MDSAAPTAEVAIEFLPEFRIYKDGRIERYHERNIIPASDNSQTSVRTKDVIISPQNGLSARLFLPQTVKPNEKLPVLVYIHGGAFVIESALSHTYHNYVSSVVAEANVLAVSVEYRLAPEHPIPACFDDCWAAMDWVASHVRQGPEPWINDHADFTKVFVAGDSAGGNIAHNMLARASADDGLGEGMKIVGMILIHPFFGIGKRDRLWECICSDSKGPDDPRLNPMTHPNLLSSLRCNKILICIAEKDFIRESGWLYYEALRKSTRWGGAGRQVEIFETKGEEHCFHLGNPNCDNARVLMKHVVSFFKDQGETSPSGLSHI